MTTRRSIFTAGAASRVGAGGRAHHVPSDVRDEAQIADAVMFRASDAAASPNGTDLDGTGGRMTGPFAPSPAA